MEKIIDKLYELRQDNIKTYNEKIIKGNSLFIGVSIPNIRKVSKYIIKNNLQEQFFKEYKGVYFEEKMLKGLILASNEEYFNKYSWEYLNNIDSWALVDIFCSSCKFIKNNLDEYWEYIKKLVDSNLEFISRTGYIFILNYYINDFYIDEIINLCLKDSDDYYVNMAIAWLISEIYINYPKRIEELLMSNKLNKFVQNKSIDKINESYRVKKEDKVRLRKLKSFN